MPTFKTMKEVEDYIKKQMAETMKQEVAYVVKKTESEKVYSEVYDAYKPKNGEPWRYRRRKKNGGLADTRNMKHKVTTNDNDVELSVENTTKSAHAKYGWFRIDDLVEYGDGHNGKQYIYKTNRDGTAWQYLRARPYTAKTIEELKNNKAHIEAFKRGMKKRGIDIE